jgi:plasmid stabilization system protein ParE
MASLAVGAPPFRDVGDLRPGLRVRRCRQHRIFCRIQEGQRPRIVAILHVRMDILARLADRLD